MNERPDIDEVEAAIARYVEEHPHAMDTLEGIAHWWLRSYRVSADLGTVELALRRLIKRGVLEELESDDQRRYRARRLRRE